MIVPDVNLLIYAYDEASPFHSAAAAWWEGCLSGNEAVGVPHVVLFGFIRLATHPRIMEEPLRVQEATEIVRSWIQQPVTRILIPGVDHPARVLSFLEKAGVAGNLTTDAQIAAHAQEHGAVVHTCDADFARFEGLRWLNPISGGAGRGRTRR